VARGGARARAAIGRHRTGERRAPLELVVVTQLIIPVGPLSTRQDLVRAKIGVTVVVKVVVW
jgi:hypothetical protein